MQTTFTPKKKPVPEMLSSFQVCNVIQCSDANRRDYYTEAEANCHSSTVYKGKDMTGISSFLAFIFLVKNKTPASRIMYVDARA